MKRTFQPNNRKKSKKMGFLARAKSKIISSRRKKGRKVLAR
ncbi:MAG: 50S ribosomal protein L34 [Bacilli bacterium]|nr:50S ribosomal protein L34 [Bacilli bacterium]